MFTTRSLKLERIDTGDYTPEEYDRFLYDIRLVNRFAGDRRALQKTLLQEIKKENLPEFSVLDIGAGSGELLRDVGKFARKQKRRAKLFGSGIKRAFGKCDLGRIEKLRRNKIHSGKRSDSLPFADKTFDYAISSLFTHHLTDEQIIKTLQEMKRVVRRKIFIIDLHRQPLAYFFYKIFCIAFRISPLVRHDGSLSILRSFKPEELTVLAQKAGLENISVRKVFPFRLVLEAETDF